MKTILTLFYRAPGDGVNIVNIRFHVWRGMVAVMWVVIEKAVGVQLVVYRGIEGLVRGSSVVEDVVVIDVTVDDVALMSVTIAFFTQNLHVGKTRCVWTFVQGWVTDFKV